MLCEGGNLLRSESYAGQEVGKCLSFDFFDAALMATTFEFRIQPYADDLERKGFRYWARANRDAVGVVVLFGHLCGPFVPAETAAYTCDLVGDDGFAIAAAAQDDAVVRIACRHRFSRRADEVWVVAGRVRVAAAVDDLVAAVAEELDDRSLQREACMVGADGNGKGRVAHRNEE